MPDEKNSTIAEEALDAVGDAMLDAVGTTGGALQDAAAKAVDLTGEAVDDVSDFIDDVTEDGPLKKIGDRVGEAGREAAERIKRKAEEMEQDDDPASV